jgi:hypothetical protein
MNSRQLGTDNFTMTLHAEARIQQRGIKRNAIDLVLHDGDLELHAGNGLMSVKLSRKRAARLSGEGVPAALLENAQNVVLLIDFSSRSIVTAMHYARKGCKHHSRQYPTWSRSSRHWCASSAFYAVAA